MNNSLHTLYVVASFVAAAVAAIGMMVDAPVVYAVVPGLIGLGIAAAATIRFFKYKRDLAGFVATFCGFVFYQAFQANPATMQEFVQGIAPVAPIDKTLGIFFGNFTAGMLLLAYRVVNALLARQLQYLVPPPQSAARERIDGRLMTGFVLVFTAVALPNILFGKVVMGAINNVIYQRATWGSPEQFSGYQTWGDPVSLSLLNTTFWSISSFFLWLYLLRSRYRMAMLLLSPLVLLWSASVALQGARTYLVIIAVGILVNFLGNPKFKGSRFFLLGGVVAGMGLVLMQMAALFRNEGLGSVDWKELGTHLFEIHGNEGTMSQMDGLEFFRVELLRKGAAPNPVVGFVRGIVERPIEGVLMPVPRRLFPWKPFDETGTEFSIYYQDVRLGVHKAEAFLGASPGLMGRELIRYGFLGPLTVLFWLGLILALADKLYADGAGCDFHRIYATVLVTFFVAQMRDWVPMWFLPFLPVMFILGWVGWATRRAARFSRPRPGPGRSTVVRRIRVVFTP